MGQDSRMFVLYKASDDSSVTRYEMKKNVLSRVRRTVRKEVIRRELASFRASGPNEMTYFADDRTPYGKDPWSQLPESDVIQLHWVSGFVDYEGFFSALPAGKPLVWTMHGMEAFTGGCYYDNDCGKFSGECGACPQVGSQSDSDLTRQVWKRKREIYSRLGVEQLHIVTPSRWLSEEVKRSSLLGSFPCTVIPNAVDTDVFVPRNRAVARDVVGVPLEAKVVLFLADGLHVRRKGLDLLVEALSRMRAMDNLLLVSLGPGQPSGVDGIRHLRFEAVNNDRFLSFVYSAADVFVTPSLQDNLPNTLLESIACGTPAVGFEVGGIPDVIRPGQTGLLAKAGEVDDLQRAIGEILENSERLKVMGLNCRTVAVEEYALEVQARRYLKLYNESVERGTVRR
jgi:glycosyltransferase involved in cell wall biosynthesis